MLASVPRPLLSTNIKGMVKTTCDNLFPLSQAKCEQDVIKVCKTAFGYSRDDGSIAETAVLLSVDNGKAKNLLRRLKSLYESKLTDVSQIQAEFSDGFPKEVSGLVASTIVSSRNESSRIAEAEASSLARLKALDWRVDVKTDPNSKVATPTCLLQLKIQDVSKTIGQEGKTSTVNVELTKESMDTVLDGLGKIRDQLSSIAK